MQQFHPETSPAVPQDKGPGPRVEDARLLTGQGHFSDDGMMEGQAAAVFLRSPHGHARILALDAAAARAMPGVLAVLTQADVTPNTISTQPPLMGGAALAQPHWPALARGRVLHVGQTVALVVAGTAAQAQDAAEAIAVEYDTLPAVVDPRAALAPGAAQIWQEAPGNLATDWAGFEDPQVDTIIAGAAHVVRLGVAQQRISGTPMEPRAATAWVAGDGRLTIRLGSQGAGMLAGALSTIMGEPVRVLSDDVGGAFGLKTSPYPEYAALLAAARLTGRPVHWRSTRTEAFCSDMQARQGFCDATLALDAQGHFLALRTQSVVDLGAFLSSHGAHISTANFARCIGTLYRIAHVAVGVRLAFTNTVPIGPYRGAGRPEANHLMERLVTTAARQLGIDALDLRRRNIIPPAALPYRSPVGCTYDSGDFEGLLDAALAAADAQGFAARRAQSAALGRLRGLGVSSFLEHSGGIPFEGAAMLFDSDGCTLRMAVHGSGQGHATIFARLAAARLGLAPGQVRVVQGDSDFDIKGAAAVASRSTAMAGSAVVDLAAEVLVRARTLAAERLEAAEADLAYADGVFTVAGTDRHVALLALAEGGALDAKGSRTTSETYPNGCHIAEVEIDPETGIVEVLAYTAMDDCGVVLDETLTHGQVMGGAAQGIGQALYENLRYDAQGQILSASFMDYAIPRAGDLPDFHSLSRPAPCLTNPLGVKGVGEAGATAGPAAVMNAIAHALPAGAGLAMPATPEAVWRAIHFA